MTRRSKPLDSIQLAYEQAFIKDGINRVLLATDDHDNESLSLMRGTQRGVETLRCLIIVCMSKKKSDTNEKIQ